MALSFTDLVENKTELSRKAQLEAYDGCARCRPVWDEIANQYDAIITPSAVDEAPLGLGSTGDAVSISLFSLPKDSLHHISCISKYRSSGLD